MQMRGRNDSGFTLVEMMVVVVVIGVLAALAVVGYRKYIARARVSEATGMLAEFAAKEQLYFLDNGQYMPAHKGAGDPSTEPGNEFWPIDINTTWDSARQSFPVHLSDGTLPPTWRQLGVRPRWNQLYCSYLVNAGAPGVAPKGTIGPTLWGGAPNVPWFYAIAACNLVGSAGWPNIPASNIYRVTTRVMTHDSPNLITSDENQ